MKKTIIIIGTVILVSLLAILVMCNKREANTEDNIEEKLALGQRYLEEMNYEQAIVTFETAIEIEPMCIEAYTGLADAYMGLGEYEAAEKVIDDASLVLGDLEELQKERESIEFMKGNEFGLRITSVYFNKENFLSQVETHFSVRVVYNCPIDSEYVLMIGTNTIEPFSYQVEEDEKRINGKGCTYLNLECIPVFWEEEDFAVYVNVSEANHGESWNPIGMDIIHINKEGAIQEKESIYQEESFNESEIVIDPSNFFQDYMLFGEMIYNWNIDKIWQYAEKNALVKQTYEKEEGMTYDYWTEDYRFCISISDYVDYRIANVREYNNDATSTGKMHYSYYESSDEYHSYSSIDVDTYEKSLYPSAKTFFSTIEDSDILYNMCLEGKSLNQGNIKYSGDFQTPYYRVLKQDVENWVYEDFTVRVDENGAIDELSYSIDRFN